MDSFFLCFADPFTLVETHRKTVEKWIKEITEARFDSMDDVCSFVERIDAELDQTLTDEVAVLKRIGNWPKRCRFRIL